MAKRTIDYDSEPVAYCKRCYSLNIVREECAGIDCCADCGGTDIAEASIGEWEALYEKRYGHKLVEKCRDPKRSQWFRMDRAGLLRALNGSAKLDEIVARLYPGLPMRYTRSDKILLLVDMLEGDGRIDDLRYELWRIEREGKKPAKD